MAQAPYLQLEVTPAENIAATAQAMLEEIHHALSLLAFISSRQRGVLGLLPALVYYPATALLRYYAEEVIPINTRLPWSR